MSYQFWGQSNAPTARQLEAIGYILDLAYEDQRTWLAIGNPESDYGDEWPGAAQRKAAHFREVAKVFGPLIAGESERWTSLAESMEASGREYVEQNKEAHS